MKKINYYSRRQQVMARRYSRRYPNSAENSYFLGRLANIFLAAATVCGTVTVFLFLFIAG